MGEAKLRALSENVIAVFTMIGGMSVIGEWSGDDEGAEFIQVRSPHLLQQDPQRPNNIIIAKMLGVGILGGDHLSLNMRAVLWITPPPRALLSAYQATRAGLVVGEKPILINQ